MKAKVIKQNVGADLSKNDFKANFQQLLSNQKSRIRGSRTFQNNPKGFKEFVEWVKKKYAGEVTVRITLEATGVYYEQLVHFLHEQTDFHISVMLPNKTNAYFKSLNIKSKTDSIDARILGQMGLERNLSRWQPMSVQIRPLRQLTRNRVSLIELKTAINNRLHAQEHSYMPNKKVVRQMKQQIKLIERQIKEMEVEIEKIIDKDGVLKVKVDNICKIKGLRCTTVASVIAETDGFALFTSRSQLVSYAGYDVVQNQSGTSVNGKTRISKKGNRYIRRALFLPAMSMSQHEPEFSRLYKRVEERTRIKMKANVAVQRKALVMIYTLFKKNEAYDPGFAEREKEEKTTIEKCRQDTNPAYAR